jgi:hypothetical protein
MLLPLSVALFLFAGVCLLADFDLVAVLAAALAPLNEGVVAYARTRVPAEPDEDETDG